MGDKQPIIGRYVGLFLVGCFLFSFPVLTIFNRADPVLGIPVFFSYLFSAWALLIFLIMLSTRLGDPPPLKRENGVSPVKG